MANPIIQMLTGRNQNPVQQVMGLLQGNPQQVLDNMLQSNPDFRRFVDENKDLTPQQICQKFGVDQSILNMIK